MSASRRHRPSAARKERSFRVAANGSNGPKPPLGSEREASPMANTMDRQLALALIVAGATGEIESVSHPFQPDGRLRASNSP
jgi:hypothetical protein